MRCFILVLFLLLTAHCSLLTVNAQLQQSGGPGSTVSITQGGNTAAVSAAGALSVNQTQINGNTVSSGNGVAGSGVQRVTIASDNTPFAIKIDQTTPGTTNKVSIGTDGTVALNAALPAGSNVIGVIKTVPSTTCGTTAVTQALAAVPTSSTAVFASTTCMVAAFFNNTNATAETVTLTDNAGTPVNGVGPAFSIPGLSNMTIPLYGVPFSSGVKWAAGGTGVTGGMVGYQ
jgi:hypothetical protein